MSKRLPLSIPELHQLKVARQTLRMNSIMVRAIGGMTKEEARQVVRRLGHSPTNRPEP